MWIILPELLIMESGILSLNPLTINQVSDVDNTSSTQIRITTIPDSVDIIPIRNQLLEIDLVNTVVNVTIDRLEIGDINTVNTTDLATSCSHNNNIWVSKMAPFDNPPTSSLSTKISPLIDGQLPDFVRDENPLFSRFIQYYYEYLEAAELLVDAQVDNVIQETFDTAVYLR